MHGRTRGMETGALAGAERRLAIRSTSTRECNGHPPRFPRIAEFYHREVISKGREIIRTIAARGYERGELPSDALVKFPQLFFAPLLTAIIWRSLFSEFDPLDVSGMIESHRKQMLGLRDGENFNETAK